MSEIRKLRSNYDPGAREPDSYAARRTGFLISFDNRWDLENHRQTKRWDTEAHWMRYYRSLKSLMAPVDVIAADADFDKYPFLVAPAYQLVDEDLGGRWRKYVEKGGHLVLSCRTGQKDNRGHLWEGPWAAPVLDLIGAKITIYDVLPATISGRVSYENRSFSWGAWGDVLEPRPGTEILAHYADQFYKGKAAAVTRKIGKGTVTYIGVDSDSGELEGALLHQVYLRRAQNQRA